MAKGIGEQSAEQYTRYTFYNLPEADQLAAEADACKHYGVADFWDLGPAVRREVREHAVAEHWRK
jgi:hypothetical protein